MHVCAVESVKCSVDTPSPEHWTPRTPPLSLPKVMTDAWSGVWAGASTSRAQAAEEALFKRHIKSPWHLGRVAIDLPDLGLGTQYINTLEVRADLEQLAAARSMLSRCRAQYPTPAAATHAGR
jgi:hypothetical protein